MPRGASNEVLARGRARQKQIAAELAAQRERLTADLLEGLSRPATALDRVNAANIAAHHVKATYLEGLGRDSTVERTKLNQALRVFGIKPAPATAKPAAQEIDKLLADIAARSGAVS